MDGIKAGGINRITFQAKLWKKNNSKQIRLDSIFKTILFIHF